MVTIPRASQGIRSNFGAPPLGIWRESGACAVRSPASGGWISHLVKGKAWNPGEHHNIAVKDMFVTIYLSVIPLNMAWYVLIHPHFVIEIHQPAKVANRQPKFISAPHDCSFHPFASSVSQGLQTCSWNIIWSRHDHTKWRPSYKSCQLGLETPNSRYIYIPLRTSNWSRHITILYPLYIYIISTIHCFIPSATWRFPES